MEQKPSGHVIPISATRSEATSLFRGGDIMKRSASELALQEFISTENDKVNERIGDIRCHRDKFSAGIEGFYGDVSSIDFNCAFKSRDMMNEFPSAGLTENLHCSPNLTPKNSSISVTMDSQSSICVASPISANQPQRRADNQAAGATSGSSDRENSDDEDVEIEAGPCEQSTDPVDLKRIKRMDSNRESARRSRKRKQAHLADLETQVDQVRGENATLYKQLTHATHQYRDSETNYRVLKSNVEAMRAKVKLAEDMVARGSLTCSLNQLSLSQLIQSHFSPPPQVSPPHLRRAAHVSPTFTVHGDDTSFSGVTGQSSGIGLGNVNINDNNSIDTAIMSDTVSCVSDLWR